MRGGHVDAVTRTTVSGWAADSAQPHARLELRVEVDGAEAGLVVAERPRPDLAALGRYGDGAHGFLFTFPRALAAASEHRISVRFDDGRLLPNGTRMLPAEEGGPAKVDRTARPAPILVTAPGRSGTTYLMSCLAASPQIVVAELVPYELRLLSYYAAAFGVLTAPADLQRSTHPDRLEGDGFHIGFNPFHGPQYAQAFRGQPALRDFQEHFAPARLGEAIADIVREYYRRLAADKSKVAAYFAEKNNNLHKPTRLFVRRAFEGLREVVIVRDPRDVLCSHMSYFASSQEKAFTHLSHSNRQLTSLQDEAGPDICVIRYEEMIAGEPETFQRLRAFLDVEVAPVQEEAGSRIFAKHATSASPQASIGRWRQDLPAELRATCRSEWGEFLTRFGYELE